MQQKKAELEAEQAENDRLKRALGDLTKEEMEVKNAMYNRRASN